jgi:hypothetical protein
LPSSIPALLSSILFPSAFPSSDQLTQLAFFSRQTDEGTAFGLRKFNTTDELVNGLVQNYVALSQNSSQELVSRYSTEQSEGCPFNTGDGVLPTGLQDKVSFEPS